MLHLKCRQRRRARRRSARFCSSKRPSDPVTTNGRGWPILSVRCLRQSLSTCGSPMSGDVLATLSSTLRSWKSSRSARKVCRRHTWKNDEGYGATMFSSPRRGRYFLAICVPIPPCYFAPPQGSQYEPTWVVPEPGLRNERRRTTAPKTRLLPLNKSLLCSLADRPHLFRAIGLASSAGSGRRWLRVR